MPITFNFKKRTPQEEVLLAELERLKRPVDPLLRKLAEQKLKPYGLDKALTPPPLSPDVQLPDGGTATTMLPKLFTQETPRTTGDVERILAQVPELTKTTPGTGLRNPLTGELIDTQPGKTTLTNLEQKVQGMLNLGISKEDITPDMIMRMAEATGTGQDRVKTGIPGLDIEDLPDDYAAFWAQNKRLPKSPEELRVFNLERGKGTEEDRRNLAMRKALPELQSDLAKIGPNAFWEKEKKVRMTDDGKIYIDPFTKSPEALKTLDERLGKRTNIKHIELIGNQMDDSLELLQLLAKPEVAENFRKIKASEATLWDRVKGTFSNRIDRWMVENGIGENSDTATAISRIQRLASEERKLFLGVAITEHEMKSSLGWMPSAGDGFDTIINKASLMLHEGEQEFRRWLQTFHNIADMSPFYKAFGLKRFNYTPLIDQVGGQQETSPAKRFEIIKVQ